jgi:sulfhydrogenase subunit alpha
LTESLKWAVEASRETVKWTATLNFPDFERDYEFVCLRHPDEYPFNEGRIVSSKGIDIPLEDFYNYFEEIHVEHSTSLHSVIKKRGEYYTGPLARYSNNFDRLPAEVQEAAREAGLGETCLNPFKSIIVRAVETLYACQEALRIIENYEPPNRAALEVPARKATCHGASEAPRGLLYHRYRIDDDGIIQDARIVPPTAQNQKVIESDLAEYVADNIKLPQDKLTWQCEQIVRNYDPCISCSCHFLKLKIERE